MRFGLLPRTQSDYEYKLVGFYVGEARYGVDIMNIREIVHPAEYVCVPAGPPYVVGVVDHRSEAVPIIDLRLCFGLEKEEVTRRSKWVLVTISGRTAALLVDQVTEVIKIGPENKRDRHSLLADGESPWVGEVFADTKGLIFELNLQSIVTEGALPESRETLE